MKGQGRQHNPKWMMRGVPVDGLGAWEDEPDEGTEAHCWHQERKAIQKAYLQREARRREQAEKAAQEAERVKRSRDIFLNLRIAKEIPKGYWQVPSVDPGFARSMHEEGYEYWQWGEDEKDGQWGMWMPSGEWQSYRKIQREFWADKKRREQEESEHLAHEEKMLGSDPQDE